MRMRMCLGCGGGSRTVAVICQDPLTRAQVKNSWCKPQGPRPPTKETCNTHLCKWKTSPYTECTQCQSAYILQSHTHIHFNFPHFS